MTTMIEISSGGREQACLEAIGSTPARRVMTKKWEIGVVG
jgi:hypothetical protein